LLLGLVLLALPGWAQADIPVAVISLVWGEVTVKHANEDYKPARWLEPVFPGDRVRTQGAGSKLLITFFSDNHQEVLSSDVEAEVAAAGLSGPPASQLRKDPARNPFGAGGVGNPFVYTRKLIEADFAKADQPYEDEKVWLQARVRPTFPPSLFWQKGSKASYRLQVFDYLGAPLWNRTVKDHRYQLSVSEANAMPKGVTYTWQVESEGQPLVARYPFNLLTRPQFKWFQEQRADFDAKKAANKLQRSDWTDLLLVSAQLNYVDEALDLLYKMAEMDPNNPNIYRALVRVYLTRGCPAHARKAHQKELELGGLDPIYP